MAKITLNNVVSVQNTSVINDNFQKIATQLNDLVFYRDVPTGEPNQLDNPIDANGERIYNLPEPAEDHEAATLKTVKDFSIGGFYLNTLRAPDELSILPSSIGRANRFLSFDSLGNPVCIFSSDEAVKSKDLYFDSATIGVVLRSPNGSYFRLKVDDSGTLSTEEA